MSIDEKILFELPRLLAGRDAQHAMHVTPMIAELSRIAGEDKGAIYKALRRLTPAYPFMELRAGSHKAQPGKVVQVRWYYGAPAGWVPGQNVPVARTRDPIYDRLDEILALLKAGTPAAPAIDPDGRDYKADAKTFEIQYSRARERIADLEEELAALKGEAND